MTAAADTHEPTREAGPDAVDRWRLRVNARLSERASAPTWRTVLAFLAAWLTAACASGGLIMWLPGLQTAALTAMVSAMIAPSWRRSAAAAGAAVAIVSLVGPFSSWAAVPTGVQRVGGAALWGITSALLAAGFSWLVLGRKIPLRVALAVPIVLIVANLAATTLTSNSQSMFDPLTQTEMPSFNRQLSGDLPSAIAQSDDAWFFYVYRRVRQGESFYTAFHYALTHNPRWKPASVMDYRLPTIFFAWSALPNARLIVVAFLVLASGALVCALPINSADVRLPLVVPACAALAAYFVSFPVQLPLFSQEAWAVTIGLAAFAANAVSFRSQSWRVWMAAAVVLAVLGTLVRETLVFVPLAGLVSVLPFRDEQRTYRAWVWLGGVAALVLAYGLHYSATARITQWVEGFGRLAGSLRNVAAAVVYSTDMLGSGIVLPYVLAGLGIVGAVLVRDARMRVFVLLSAVLPLVAFLVLGNRAWYETSGQVINYWGATVIPLLYVLIPRAFTLLPLASPERMAAAGAPAQGRQGPR